MLLYCPYFLQCTPGIWWSEDIGLSDQIKHTPDWFYIFRRFALPDFEGFQSNVFLDGSLVRGVVFAQKRRSWVWGNAVWGENDGRLFAQQTPSLCPRSSNVF